MCLITGSKIPENLTVSPSAHSCPHVSNKTLCCKHCISGRGFQGEGSNLLEQTLHPCLRPHHTSPSSHSPSLVSL